MGLIQSLSVPYDGKIIAEPQSRTSIVNRLLDEILIEFSSLIADIDEGNVDASILKNEIEKCISREKGLFDPESIKTLLLDTIYGYGLLQPLILDADITDIDAPRYDYILVKRFGKIEKSPLKFESEQDFERFCKLLIIRNGGLINEVDNHSRVSDKVNHLRINVNIPPRNVEGASLNIRKHAHLSYTYEQLQTFKFFDEESKCLLQDINLQKKNLLICGKSASGKTTLLRTLIDNGDELERMLICESDTELYPQKRNAIVQYIKKSEYGGKLFTLADLIKEGLTMSLDAYCIGEIISGEAWEYIKAGYTDHRIMGTIHASSALDALDRLLMLIENETRIEQHKLMQIISKSIHYVIYLKGFKVQEIIKLNCFDKVQDCYQYETLYKNMSNEGSKWQ